MDDPDESLDALRLLSQFYMDHGRPDSALALLRALCLLAPDDRQAMLCATRAALLCGQAQEAERMVHRLRDAGEPSAVLHLLEGQVLAALGRRAEAEHAFGEFIESRAARAQGARP